MLRDVRMQRGAAYIIVFMLLFMLLIPFGITPAHPVLAQQNNTALVIVQLEDGTLLEESITFSEPTISGIEALELTGLDFEKADFGSFGAAVCSIEGTGCPVDDCFCDQNNFWNYVIWEDGAWVASPVGASSSVVRNLSIEGWAWGEFGSVPAVEPGAPTDELQVVKESLTWLRTQQLDDGSYATGFGSKTGGTLNAILAIAAANEDNINWRSPTGNSTIEYVRDVAIEDASARAANAGKLALGVAAAGLDPHDFGGVNLIAMINQHYDPATGAYGFDNWDQAFSLLGLRAAGSEIPEAAVETLLNRAAPEGYWPFAPQGNFAYVDTTSLALMALIAADVPTNSPAITDGIAFIRDQQMDDGGFPDIPVFGGGEPTSGNPNTTALAIQALLAAGEDPLNTDWTRGDQTPVSFLLSLAVEGGGIRFPGSGDQANLLATNQVIPALVGKPLPYLSPAVAQRTALDWIATQQQDDGSFAGFNPGATIDAIFAIVVAGDEVPQTALDYLEGEVAAYAAISPAAAGKLTVGVVAAGDDPRDFGGVDLVAQIKSYYNATAGQFLSTGFASAEDQAWPILGLAAAGEEASAEATNAAAYLTLIQAPDGGWGASPYTSASVDTTALVLQALATIEPAPDDFVTPTSISKGLEYLRRVQNGDGGFPGFDGSTSASSTGLALQALAAYDENPRSLNWTTTITDGTVSPLTLHTPIDAVLALQSADGGFAGFSGPNDPFSTYQAIPGIAAKPFPLNATSAATITASFSATPLEGSAPLTVTFSNDSSGDIIYHQWDFGDGMQSWLSNPQHVYQSGGSYTVTLTITGTASSDTVTRTSYITTDPAPVQASFTISPTLGKAPLDVTFINESTGDFTSSAWEFGDGTTSTEMNPTHTYTESGEYEVTLTVSGSGGEGSTTRTAIVVPETSHVMRVGQDGEGGTFVFTDTTGIGIELIFPTLALTIPTDIVYTPTMTDTELADDPDGFQFADVAFTLDAYRDGTLLPTVDFGRPVSITITYRDSSVADAVENDLLLFYLDEMQAPPAWVDAATTCDPISQYDRSPTEDRLGVAVCHLTQFGMFQPSIDGSPIVYLPLVQNAVQSVRE